MTKQPTIKMTRRVCGYTTIQNMGGRATFEFLTSLDKRGAFRRVLTGEGYMSQQLAVESHRAEAFAKHATDNGIKIEWAA